MPALQVRDCPSDLYEELKSVAVQENRSISQQTIFILREFLAQRQNGQLPAQRQSKPQPSYVNTERTDGIDYAAKHRAVWERIQKLPPIPHSETFPSAVEILRQIREEEAR